MVKRTISITLFFLLLTPMIINAQGDGKHKENKKIEKVTSVTMQHENEEQGDSLQDAEENEEALRKDFSTIRKEVEESSVPTVIKAVSLGIFIFGLAYVYLPKKRKEKSDD